MRTSRPRRRNGRASRHLTRFVLVSAVAAGTGLGTQGITFDHAISGSSDATLVATSASAPAAPSGILGMFSRFGNLTNASEQLEQAAEPVTAEMQAGYDADALRQAVTDALALLVDDAFVLTGSENAIADPGLVAVRFFMENGSTIVVTRTTTAMPGLVDQLSLPNAVDRIVSAETAGAGVVTVAVAVPVRYRITTPFMTALVEAAVASVQASYEATLAAPAVPAPTGVLPQAGQAPVSPFTTSKR